MPELHLPEAWKTIDIENKVLEEISQTLQDPFLPPATQIFTALEACPPSDVRVIVLGQDPYPTPGHAHGLAFSVTAQTRPLPRSLTNIFKEMQADLKASPATGDLSSWARQGVLLLNTVLTVAPHAANAHKSLGWQAVTQACLRHLDDRPRALLLWGKQAQEAARVLQNPDHLRIETAHPSPLSARRGFFGSRPFSRVNEWLKAKGHAEIDWING